MPCIICTHEKIPERGAGVLEARWLDFKSISQYEIRRSLGCEAACLPRNRGQKIAGALRDVVDGRRLDSFTDWRASARCRGLSLLTEGGP
jgi:hypothetical protein